jgi:PII-like signaling protein
MLDGRAERLRIFLGESDQHHHQPVFVEIVHRARSSGMAGATAFHGSTGFGASSHLHIEHRLRLSSDLPIIITIVDDPERIAAFVEDIDELLTDGLVIRQRVHVVRGDGRLGELAQIGSHTWRQGLEERDGHMRLEGSGKRLTIYCGEGDRYSHRSLVTAIVELAREEGLAGATAIRGVEGFGAANHLHTTRILSLSDDLPVVIEIVDRDDRILSILPRIEQMIGDGLVTLEDVEVSLYRARSPGALDDEPSPS